MMNKNEDPIAAFGSAEEGNEPLKPYMDPTLFDTIDEQTQIDLLTPVLMPLLWQVWITIYKLKTVQQASVIHCLKAKAYWMYL